MNSIDETLWNYIDGNCTTDEYNAISSLIETDENYSQKYIELLAFNKEVAAMELDEPPMAFTYKVLETIRTQNASAPLKATINKRVIIGIAVFFAVAMLVLITIIFYGMGQSVNNLSFTNAANAPALVTPRFKNLFNGPVLKGFLFFDVVLGLFLIDGYLRKRTFFKNV